MKPKPLKNIFTKFIVSAFAMAVLSSGIPAAGTATTPTIPDNLIARKLKKHDESVAISPKMVLDKLRQHQELTLVDVRSKEEFKRLYIPGSVNVPLYAVKTKTFLKIAPIILVNGGFQYDQLEDACRQLSRLGFKASILDGGLPAWKNNGGQVVGDFFAIDEMKSISPQVFFREKDYESTLVIDISPTRSEASSRLIPYAQHLRVLDDNGGSAAGFGELLSPQKNKPFQSIIIFNETGEQYEKAEKIMTRMGIETFNLQGGVAGYQKYLENLLISWKPRDSRMKTVGDCKPCGEEQEESSPAPK